MSHISPIGFQTNNMTRVDFSIFKRPTARPVSGAGGAAQRTCSARIRLGLRWGRATEHTVSWAVWGVCGGFHEWMYSKNGWFLIENPIKMDDLVAPLFSETRIW